MVTLDKRYQTHYFKTHEILITFNIPVLIGDNLSTGLARKHKNSDFKSDNNTVSIRGVSKSRAAVSGLKN